MYIYLDNFIAERRYITMGNRCHVTMDNTTEDTMDMMEREGPTMYILLLLFSITLTNIIHLDRFIVERRHITMDNQCHITTDDGVDMRECR